MVFKVCLSCHLFAQIIVNLPMPGESSAMRNIVTNFIRICWWHKFNGSIENVCFFNFNFCCDFRERNSISNCFIKHCMSFFIHRIFNIKKNVGSRINCNCSFSSTFLAWILFRLKVVLNKVEKGLGETMIGDLPRTNFDYCRTSHDKIAVGTRYQYWSTRKVRQISLDEASYVRSSVKNVIFIYSMTGSCPLSI